MGAPGIVAGVIWDEAEYDATGTCTGGYITCDCTNVPVGFKTPSKGFEFSLVYADAYQNEYQWWWKVTNFDARGLQTEDLDFPNISPKTDISSNTGPVNELLARIPEPEPDPALLELASRTGGRAYFNRNDLETGIRRALDDSRFSYLLAYYPTHNQWKGEWRKIQVKVDRPNVTVLARGGYFALPDSRPLPPKSRFEFLSQIAASPVDATELPLTVHIETSSSAKDAQIRAAVHLEPRLMLTEQENGRWTGHFELMFMQIGAKNKLLDATQKDVEADLNRDEYAAILRNGWNLTANLPFKSGATTLYAILHDKSSDEVGSVRIPVHQDVAPSVH